MKSLTAEVAAKAMTLGLRVSARHCYGRFKKDWYSVEDHADMGERLKENDFLYHEVFVIAKDVLKGATLHTIEEMQAFCNIRTPPLPWIHVVHTLVPLSCCDEAATYLIHALGGEDAVRELVDGVKWWQVRGVAGIDGQWMTMKKDQQEAKEKQSRMGDDFLTSECSDDTYDKSMDTMACVLYLHGGGYYFGSVDQARYSCERFARKIGGRVFAINYRLAPQYPFPCALQDALAAYLFLIRPPQGSDHAAIDPAHVIISGDSAGGGLTLAVLQILRDTGLPLPAGGVLISPWCDLMHSFPSVHRNIESDLVPESGISFHKPSELWPPPPSTSHDHIKRATGSARASAVISGNNPVEHSETGSSSPQGVQPDSREREKVTMRMSTGEEVEITEQLQFYTVNSLLTHPLVSPITGYLGGLPPLLFIAGDGEVLRDEVIYTAHKAAYPEIYSAPSTSRLQDIPKVPTSVHLQLYDGVVNKVLGAPHIFPILFTFTSSSKFCFRAIATFDKFVTGMKMDTSTRPSGLWPFYFTTNRGQPNKSVPDLASVLPSPTRTNLKDNLSITNEQSSFRQLFTRIRQVRSIFPPSSQKPRDELFGPQIGSYDDRQEPASSSGVIRIEAGLQVINERTERRAGEPQVYEKIKNVCNWECRMIRERVSTTGVIRPLEPEAELAACNIPADRVSRPSEDTVGRYLANKIKFEQTFGDTIKNIEKQRKMAKAKEGAIGLDQVFGWWRRGETVDKDKEDYRPTEKNPGFDARVLTSPGWSRSLALDESENPPPSSVAARRDAEEGRRLAAVVDCATAGDGYGLWKVIQSFIPDSLEDRSRLNGL